MADLGIPCGPDNILITSGSQQALDYLGKLFLSPNDTALVCLADLSRRAAGVQCL